MRKTALFCLMVTWFAFTGIISAQISTFPAPPPLAPPPDRSNSNPNNQPRPMPAMVPADTTTPTPAAPPGPAAPLTAATLTSMEALNDKITLHVGDQISFRVIEDRDEAVTRVVTDTGEVDFPYVGRFKVLDKTCHQIATELKHLLEVDYYKRATVIVGLDHIFNNETEKTHDLVWVIGEVRSEGPQELAKSQVMTVSQIILRAGGFGTYADQRKVRLIHKAALTPNTSPDAENPKAGQVIDVKAIFEGHPGADPVVGPEDRIIVPKKILNI